MDDQNPNQRKPKTEAQKARERERRKRRRQNKKQLLALTPGTDVPKILDSAVAEEAGMPPAPDVETLEESVLPASDYPPTEDLVEVEPVAPPELEVVEPEPLPLEPDASQQIFEEGVQTEVDEDELNRLKREEAERIASSLQQDNELLEEVPRKQGLLGKFFDLLEKMAEKRRSKSFDAAPAPVQAAEKNSAVILPVLETIHVEEAQLEGRGSIISTILKWLFRLVILAVLVVAAFWVGSSLKVMDYVNQLWKPAPPGLELYVSGESTVITDSQMLEKWGFETARLVGANLGNAADMTYNVFFNANYFGRLLDPMSITETGISAALYYGFGRDTEYMRNRFVFYVQFLAKLRNSNMVRISDVLDGKVRRDLALDGFIEETQAIFDEGNKYRKEIGVQVDDLKIAVNTINPDKDRYENDFFIALEATNAEKADTLIHSFVEITQKQVELKAKLAALTQLYQYYEKSLVEMKMRIEAVKTNREALISGVAVTETPGVDLGLIRQQ